MKLISVLVNTAEYQQAVAIRTAAFFKDMPNAEALINDAYEAQAEHIVCLENDTVIGTGRLHVENNQGVVSQMAVAAAHQKKGIGTSIIKECIARSKAKHLQSVRLAARCTAVEFYRTFNFKVSGEIYPSQKTGIPHQNMILQLFTNNNIE